MTKQRKRKSPIKHKVKSHTREGKRVQSFLRGKGQKNPRVRKTQKKVIGMHTHWIFGTKYQERTTHPISIEHRNVSSIIRHDRETGKYEEWAKSKGLKLVDSTEDKYIREVISQIKEEK